ncbi:CDP-glycerol glycerophosphotransferase family protein [Desulfosoma caldarium]|uniref:CDP-glycerol glycerophosphotransferase family protein n=1 Tax=Desulfosoma caldarium TaxID=610254 RepID=UPI0014736F3C|nr:CDP-glycerol glycerophosphotransferase family protein [Desulfosoma caldarium]
MMLNAQIALYGSNDFVDADRWFWQSCLDGAIRIQMWHGILVKDACAMFLPRTRNFSYFTGLLYDCYMIHFSIAENIVFQDVYQSNFPNSQVLPFGSVRNDILVRKDVVSSLWRLGLDRGVFNAIEEAKVSGKKIVLCCPTFRQEYDTSDSYIKSWAPAILSLSAQPDIRIAFKMHPIVKHFSHLKRMMHISKTAGAYCIPASQDIHPYYNLADCLITDYSWVWADFILCERPIIFYRPDLHTYTQTRDVISYPFFDITDVGPMCTNTHDIIKHTLSQLEQPSILTPHWTGPAISSRFGQ